MEEPIPTTTRRLLRGLNDQARSDESENISTLKASQLEDITDHDLSILARLTSVKKSDLSKVKRKKLENVSQYENFLTPEYKRLMLSLPRQIQARVTPLSFYSSIERNKVKKRKPKVTKSGETVVESHPYSSFEMLPAEVLQLIFLHSRNLDLPVVSKSIYYKLTSPPLPDSAKTPGQEPYPMVPTSLHLRMLHFLSVPLKHYEISEPEDPAVFQAYFESNDHAYDGYFGILSESPVQSRKKQRLPRKQKKLRVADVEILNRRFVTAQALAMSGIKFFINGLNTSKKLSNKRYMKLFSNPIVIPDVLFEQKTISPVLQSVVNQVDKSYLAGVPILNTRQLLIILQLLCFNIYRIPLAIPYINSDLLNAPIPETPDQEDSQRIPHITEIIPRQYFDNTLGFRDIQLDLGRYILVNTILRQDKDVVQFLTEASIVLPIPNALGENYTDTLINEAANREATNSTEIHIFHADKLSLALALQTKSKRIIKSVLKISTEVAKCDDIVWEWIINSRNSKLGSLVEKAGGRPSIETLTQLTKKA